MWYIRYARGIMKRVAVIFLFLSAATICCAQTKIYLTAGTNFNTKYYIEGFYQATKGNYIFKTDGSYQTTALGKFLAADLIIEKRINKSIYGITGLTLIQAGYNNHYQTNYSELNCTYLGVPLMIRFNFANAFLLDIGPIARFPLRADLNETALKGSSFEVSDHQDISKYLSSLSMGFSMQGSIVINRFLLTGFLTFGGNSVDESFIQHWKLNGSYTNNSLFLRDMRPKFTYIVTGIKLGIMIK